MERASAEVKAKATPNPKGPSPVPAEPQPKCLGYLMHFNAIGWVLYVGN